MVGRCQNHVFSLLTELHTRSRLHAKTSFSVSLKMTILTKRLIRLRELRDLLIHVQQVSKPRFQPITKVAPQIADARQNVIFGVTQNDDLDKKLNTAEIALVPIYNWSAGVKTMFSAH